VTAPGYKENVLRVTSRDTVITAAYTGKPCRVIRNECVSIPGDTKKTLQRSDRNTRI